MTRQITLADLERIDRTILNTLAELFAEPEFDNDGGEVLFLDQDDRCVLENEICRIEKCLKIYLSEVVSAPYARRPL